jgi:hypothetical protein
VTRMALGTVLAFGLALGGCVQQQVMQKEDLLAAAGFSSKPADTPQRAAFLHQLPPHKFVRVVRNNQATWFYADPTICACLYAGDTRAYDNYRHEVFEKHLADEREMTAQMNADAALDWSTWGPWAPYYVY